LPLGFGSALTGSLSLYLVSDGTELPERLDIDQSGLTPTSQLGWITLSTENSQMQVYTSSNSEAGTY